MRKKIVVITGILTIILGILIFSLFSIFRKVEEPTLDYKLGDKIILKINVDSQTKIEEVFKDFEIAKIEKIEEKELKGESVEYESYIVIIRSFELGEKIINYNDKELKFNVVTNLKDGEDNIYLDYTDRSIKRWRRKFPFNLLIGVCLFGSALWILLKKEKLNKIETPYEKYQKSLKNLSENYQFEISYALRKYIDSQLMTNFINGEYKENLVVTTKDVNFIRELDYSKFSHKEMSTIEEIKEKSDEIVIRIQEHIQRQNDEVKEKSKKTK